MISRSIGACSIVGAQDRCEQLRNLAALRGSVERVFEPAPHGLLDLRLRPAEAVAARAREGEDERLARHAEAAARAREPVEHDALRRGIHPVSLRRAPWRAHGRSIRTGDELTSSAASTAISASAAHTSAAIARFMSAA